MVLKDKVVLITGGSLGIGKACAEVFGKAGAKIVITGRNEEALEATKQDLEAQGIVVLAIRADVAIEDDNERMVAQTVAAFGRLDILMNNAGVSMRALFEEVDLKVIRQLMEVNFFGTVYATKYALPHIIAQKGSIIGISSIAGYRGLPERSGYSASKFAMNGFLEALRTEMLPKGVHVLVACPGYTASNIRNTALTKDGSQQGASPREEGKLMTAEAVAELILKATVKRKRDLILTREGKLAVFLNRFFPKMMDKIIYKREFVQVKKVK
ncbi:MAG: SDR family oxidoreductase [Cytophagales bacterium]|nr:MAG: SDR family oxidoreductase [Cytophagales bacterium]